MSDTEQTNQERRTLENGTPYTWTCPSSYRKGDRVTWNPHPYSHRSKRVTLVCRRNHYAGDAAQNPYDPFSGWGPLTQLFAWRPTLRSIPAWIGWAFNTGGLNPTSWRAR